MALITGTTVSTDVAPAISIDLVNELHNSYRALAEILGISRMDAVPEGNTINVYKSSVKGNIPAQVAEGVEIGLTETQRVATPITMTLKKFRKLTTAEAIQKSGRENAIYDTDRALIRAVRAGVKADFNTFLATGTGTATAGATLQAACANLWAAIQNGFEDIEVEGQTVFFVNPLDAAEYLGSAAITMQEAFGLQYVKNFLGMGTLILSNKIAKGAPVATVSDNLKGAYIAADGELSVFGYSFDDTGLIGVNHSVASDRVSIDTNAISGVKFYAEDLALVFKGSITQG